MSEKEKAIRLKLIEKNVNPSLYGYEYMVEALLYMWSSDSKKKMGEIIDHVHLKLCGSIKQSGIARGIRTALPSKTYKTKEFMYLVWNELQMGI